MSTVSVLPRPVATGRVTFPRVLRSEWTKLWSLRSTRWALGAGVASMVALGIIVALVDVSGWSDKSAAERAALDPIGSSLVGTNLAQLAIGVLAVMMISGEYTTGMIRSSMAAVPRRLPVLGAKLVVFSAVTFVLMLGSALAAFVGAQLVYASKGVDASLGDPGALRAVFGCALFLTVLGLLAAGLGALARNTAGGISAFVALLFVLPGVAEIAPASISDPITPYLPSTAGGVLATAVPDAGLLSPWVGFAVFCGYAAIVLGAAALLLVRRDV